MEVLRSISNREVAIAGGVAMATAFATYLGPYSFAFRREMLTVHWPKCLEERGVALVLDTHGGPFPDAYELSTDELQTTVSIGLGGDDGNVEDSDFYGTDENGNYEASGEVKQVQGKDEAENDSEIRDERLSSASAESKVKS